MQTVNETTRSILLYILNKLEERVEMVLEGSLHIPLTVHLIDWSVQTTWGTGKVLSIAQWGLKDGVLYMDPGMEVIIVDNRTKPTDYDNLIIITRIFRAYSFNLVFEACVILRHAIVGIYPEKEQSISSMADTWLAHLQKNDFFN